MTLWNHNNMNSLSVACAGDSRDEHVASGSSANERNWWTDRKHTNQPVFLIQMLTMSPICHSHHNHNHNPDRSQTSWSQINTHHQSHCHQLLIWFLRKLSTVTYYTVSHMTTWHTSIAAWGGDWLRTHCPRHAHCMRCQGLNKDTHTHTQQPRKAQ